MTGDLPALRDADRLGRDITATAGNRSPALRMDCAESVLKMMPNNHKQPQRTESNPKGLMPWHN